MSGASELTSEWPSTYILILGCSEPLWVVVMVVVVAVVTGVVVVTEMVMVTEVAVVTEVVVSVVVMVTMAVVVVTVVVVAMVVVVTMRERESVCQCKCAHSYEKPSESCDGRTC